MKITITIKNYDELKKVEELAENNSSIQFNIIDTRYWKERKAAYKIKSHWGARLDPFAVINDDIIKVFYSEDRGKDVIEQIELYLKEKSKL